jgi:hypothetical protein
MDLGLLTSKNKMTTTPLCLPLKEAFICMITGGTGALGRALSAAGGTWTIDRFKVAFVLEAIPIYQSV